MNFSPQNVQQRRKSIEPNVDHLDSYICLFMYRIADVFARPLDNETLATGIYE